MTDAAYNAKQWLNRLIDLFEQAKETERALELIESRLNNTIRSYDYSGRGKTDLIVKQQQREDLLIDYSIKKGLHERQYNEYLLQEVITIKLFERMQNRRAAAILFCRYLNRETWKEIEKNNSFNLSRAQIQRDHAQGLEELAKLLENIEEPQRIQEAQLEIEEAREKLRQRAPA